MVTSGQSERRRGSVGPRRT